MLRIHSIALLTALFLPGCKDKKEDVCNNPDADNYGYLGTDDQTCIFPSDKIEGGWNMKVEEYPLQQEQEGDIFEFRLTDKYCPGPENSYKYINLITTDAPLDPYEFCILLNGYDFEIDSAMHLTWTGAFMTGTGSFAHSKFVFNGTIHKQDGTDWPIRLSGSKWL